MMPEVYVSDFDLLPGHDLSLDPCQSHRHESKGQQVGWGRSKVRGWTVKA